MRKLSFLIAILMLFTIVLSGCGESEKTAGDAEQKTSEGAEDKGEKAEGNEAAPAGAPEGKDKLIVATAYDSKSLSPYAQNDVASANVNRQMYDTLVVVDNNGAIIEGGGLAEKAEQIGDKEYKIVLKKGIKFHNGDELKAEDAIFSLTQAAESAQLQHIFGTIDTSSFKQEDDYTFTFSIEEVNTPFMSAMAHQGGAIVNKKEYEAHKDDYGITYVCGTGPFKLVKWQKSYSVTLERFDDYWGEKPAFKEMEIRIIPEPTSRTVALEAGDVDIAYEIATNDIKRIEENPQLAMHRKIDNSTQYLGMNCSKAPFDNKKVRQAISYAIDMPAIVENVYRGVGQPATGPIGPNVKYSLSAKLEPHEFNPEKAKELLKEAGYADGFTCTLSTNEKKERVDMAEIIKEQLKEIGITVEIEVLEWGAYLDKLGKGEQDMFEIGWTPSPPDPDIGLFAPLSSTTKGEGANFAFYDNKEVDELLMKGRELKDGPEREEVYKKLQEIVIEDCPWVFQYNNEATVGAQKYIQNLDVTPFGYHPLYQVTFK